ncbi:uncharacterized protein LOC126184454, partial [Schistocerca cancellata]|uniref:uncharacterized protein LOC126184454 n=1 Tax=Schistocerca cancellata TaxID=274614 RepID=UPI002119667D
MYFPKPLSKKRNQEIDFTLLQTVVKDYLPFNIVESKHFQSFVGKLKGAYRMPSRKTISNTLLQQQYAMMKEISDNAANIVAAIRLTAWKHITCFAHTLNLIV